MSIAHAALKYKRQAGKIDQLRRLPSMS